MRHGPWVLPAVALVALVAALAYWGRSQALPLEPGAPQARHPSMPARAGLLAAAAAPAPARPAALLPGHPPPAGPAGERREETAAPPISEQPEPGALFPGATTLFPGSTEPPPDFDEGGGAMSTPDGLPGAGQPLERSPERLPRAIPALTP